MSNNVQTLTGGEFATGSATDNSQTDQFAVYGPDNTIEEDGGNLTVVGEADPGFKPKGNYDTQTTIHLGGSSNAVKTTINVTLDGSGNSSSGATYKSTIDFTVTGKGPSGDANVTFGDDAGTGNNFVDLENQLGTTTVKLVGTDNNIILNGDATNTAVAGNGNEHVEIGDFNDDTFGFTSRVTATGSDNVIDGGDENFTVNAGANINFIRLGDGTNSVTVTGAGNAITVGGGNNVINAGSDAIVAIDGIDGSDSAAFPGYDDSSDRVVPSNPNDTVTIAGTMDTVQATYENVTVNGTGVTGGATIDLGNGNNAVNLGGNGSTVSLGNGSNTVTLTGADNLVQVTSTKG
ncbi:MAG: hypothetical protein JO264_21150, partial [Acidisphaera sp.]|nr:hypothetical protein [Acidisphaera sp.]